MNFMNLGVFNLFTLHHCFLLNLKPKFQNHELQSGYIYINPGTDHMWDTYINLTLWLQF